MKFCVIGAGSGGRAMASYLISKKHHVNLYNRSLPRIADIKKKGTIVAEGALKGEFPVDLVTQDLESAVRKVEVILIVTPAYAHGKIARDLTPFLREGQIILLNPGRTFGSVEFIRTIEKIRGRSPCFVGETQTLLFTSRQMVSNRVDIIKIKNSVNLSAYPDIYTYLIHSKLKNVFPQLNPIGNYLEVTLNNIGMLLHPTITLLNAGAIDSDRKFKFYKEGASKNVCKVLNSIEKEIRDILAILGITHLNFCKWAEKSYGIKANCIQDSLQKIEAYKNIDSPNKLFTRYLLEDVPTGLVPFSSLGKFFNVPTPTIDSIIHLCSIICGIDFSRVKRTVEKLDLKRYLMEKIQYEEYKELNTPSYQIKKKIFSF